MVAVPSARVLNPSALGPGACKRRSPVRHKKEMKDGVVIWVPHLAAPVLSSPLWT